jgi:hypothetical protein
MYVCFIGIVDYFCRVMTAFAKATAVNSGCGAVGPVPLAERGSTKNLFRGTERFFGTSVLALCVLLNSGCGAVG